MTSDDYNIKSNRGLNLALNMTKQQAQKLLSQFVQDCWLNYEYSILIVTANIQSVQD